MLEVQARVCAISDESELSMDSRFPGLLADAAATLARLDERLSSAPACVTEGWLARALIGEAVASARLNGDIADAADLTLLDAIDRVPDPALGQAAVILAMLGSMSKRGRSGAVRDESTQKRGR